MKYRIDKRHSHLFNVDTDAGIISTKVILSKEQLASMTFSVIAYDLGVPSRSSTATVMLHLQEDASLTFDKPSYSFVVFENQSPRVEVGQVTAFDSAKSAIRYDLFPEVSDADFADVAFEINATTGKIYTKMALDRERQAYFRLRATARGAAVHAGTAVTRVGIHVADLNDNRPRVHWPPHNDINDTVIRLSTGVVSHCVTSTLSLSLYHYPHIQCRCPRGKSLFSRILDDQFSSPYPCPRPQQVLENFRGLSRLT